MECGVSEELSSMEILESRSTSIIGIMNLPISMSMSTLYFPTLNRYFSFRFQILNKFEVVAPDLFKGINVPFFVLIFQFL